MSERILIVLIKIILIRGVYFFTYKNIILKEYLNYINFKLFYYINVFFDKMIEFVFDRCF